MEALKESAEYKECAADMSFLRELVGEIGPFLLPFGAHGKEAAAKLASIPEHFNALMQRAGVR